MLGPARPAHLALRSARTILLCIVPIVALLVLLSPWVARLYGPEFADGSAVFAVVSVAAAIMAPYGALTNYVIARQRMWARFAISLLWIVILLAGAALLVAWGAIGIACATLIAYTAQVVVTYLYARPLVRS